MGPWDKVYASRESPLFVVVVIVVLVVAFLLSFFSPLPRIPLFALVSCPLPPLRRSRNRSPRRSLPPLGFFASSPHSLPEGSPCGRLPVKFPCPSPLLPLPSSHTPTPLPSHSTLRPPSSLVPGPPVTINHSPRLPANFRYPSHSTLSGSDPFHAPN